MGRIAPGAREALARKSRVGQECIPVATPPPEWGTNLCLGGTRNLRWETTDRVT